MPTNGLLGRQVWDLPTDDDDEGRLLPTPLTVPDSEASHGQLSGTFRDAMWTALERTDLLPTPSTSDTNGISEHGNGQGYLRNLPELLPTPNAADGKGGPGGHRGGGENLRTAIRGLPADDDADEGDLLPTPRNSPAMSASTTEQIQRTLQTTGYTHRLEEAVTLLPTPTAGNAADGADLEAWEDARQALKAKGYNGNGRGTPLAVAVRQQIADSEADQPADGLLPTPRATDGTKGGPNQRGSSGDRMLPSAVHRLTGEPEPEPAEDAEPPALLPTPTVTDSNGGRNNTCYRGPDARKQNPGDTLTDWAWKREGYTDPKLLPTPSVSDGTGGHVNRSGDRRDELLLPGIAQELTRNAQADAAVDADADDEDGWLMPTPTSGDAVGTGYAQSWDELTREDGRHRLRDAAAVVAGEGLLPTPCAEDSRASGGAASREDGRQVMLHHAAKAHARGLLPTPRVTQPGFADDGRGGRSLDVEARSRANWGNYAPAIARWERTLDRPAPSPTEPGTKGQPRLSPTFVEWLMGLPEGHVTGVGIGRNAQLKALGNGVVPQQAAAAIAWLLDVRAEVA